MKGEGSVARFWRVVLIAAVLAAIAVAARAVRSFLNEGATSPRTNEPTGPVAPPGHAHGDARGVIPFTLGSAARKQQGLITGYVAFTTICCSHYLT